MEGRSTQTSRERTDASGSADLAARTHDADRTRDDILSVAMEEFAEHGLAGARIDEIAAKTQTSKRMIYYYFESKESLYQAVLENEYRRIRRMEGRIELDCLPPLEALRKLVGFTFDFTFQNEAFVRLVMIENIHRGAFLGKIADLRELSTAMMDEVRKLYHRGASQGVFRKGIDPLELHWQISALCFFNVSNRSTFSRLFGLDMADPAAHSRRRQSVIEMVERQAVEIRPSATRRNRGHS